MLRIDRDAAIRRFDELFDLVNGPDSVNERGAPASPVLEVLTFKTLNAAEASFLADRHGADELYHYAEIRGGKFQIRHEYKKYELKGAKLRREHRTAWSKWYKAETAPPPKPKKPRAPRKRKGGVA